MFQKLLRTLSVGPLAILAATTLGAQTKVVPGQTSTISATVEAIDQSRRVVTLKGPKGNYVDVAVPADVKRFDNIKVGDKLTATYYENLVLSVQRPGEKPKDTASAARMNAPAALRRPWPGARRRRRGTPGPRGGAPSRRRSRSRCP